MTDESIASATVAVQTLAIQSPPTLQYTGRYDSDSTLDRLTRGDVICVAVKIIGFYALIQSLPTVVLFVETFTYRFEKGRALGACITVAAYVAIGLFLISKAEMIARWLLPRTAVVTAGPPSHAPAQMQAVAMSIVGLVLCVWSVPTLVWIVGTIALADRKNAIQINLQTRVETEAVSLFRYAVQAALGIWLFFGSRQLATWWWSLRHSEFRQTPAEENPDDTGQNPHRT